MGFRFDGSCYHLMEASTVVTHCCTYLDCIQEASSISGISATGVWIHRAMAHNDVSC